MKLNICTQFTSPKFNVARTQYPNEIRLRKNYLKNPSKYASKFQNKLKLLKFSLKIICGLKKILPPLIPSGNSKLLKIVKQRENFNKYKQNKLKLCLNWTWKYQILRLLTIRSFWIIGVSIWPNISIFLSTRNYDKTITLRYYKIF